MSSGNQGDRIAALAKQGQEDSSSSQRAGGNDQAASGETGEVSALVEQSPRPDEAVEDQQQAEGQEPDPYAARDIIAQEMMAEASVVMAVAALLTFLVTLTGTFLIWTQVKLTRKAVEETGDATKAMVESNRIVRRSSQLQLAPYIAFTSASIGMNDDGDPICTVSYRNFGQTPAAHLKIFAGLHIGAPPVFDGIIPQKELSTPDYIAPGQTLHATITIECLEGVANDLRDRIENGDILVLPITIGYIANQFVEDVPTREITATFVADDDAVRLGSMRIPIPGEID
ncbi:hypothetical protein [Erythrobacter sp.]|uniref:hypothetical protein n=1 Tax=Erythrobacter sp. TaxID=1042 RepID=UPI001425D849|nr:hypothetical protein [Erythrobacter sp.]QIQ85481.1 MAG: hypothetical protein G9473_01385 [Erythrobacter sp.]